jgi:hypothetical protein
MAVVTAQWRGFLFGARAGRHRMTARIGPSLARGERELLSERDTRTGRRVVATAHAVHYRDLAAGSWQRIGWEQIEHADWHPAPGELRLAGRWQNSAPGAQAPVAALDSHARAVALELRLRVAAPERLLSLARERIAATTLAQAPLRHEGRAVGAVTARRAAADDHAVTWVVRLHPGTDLPETEIAGAIANLKAHIGQ